MALYRDYAQDYMRAYEDAIRATATPDAPWYVIPANNKWFTRVIVAAAIIHTLAALDLHYPKVDKGKRRDLAAARRALVPAGRAVASAPPARPLAWLATRLPGMRSPEHGPRPPGRRAQERAGSRAPPHSRGS